MTAADKIRFCLAEFGLIEKDYFLTWYDSLGQWELRMPKHKSIYASCARTMIRAIRRGK